MRKVIHYDEIYGKRGASHWKQWEHPNPKSSELYKKHVKKVIKHYKGKTGRFLDVGCGDGLILHLVEKNSSLDCFGIDVSKVGIDIAHSKGVHNCKAVDLLEFNSQPFDYIFMGDTLEHIQDTDKAMEKVFGLLKPNGELMLAHPIQDEIRPDDYHLYTKEEMDKIVNKYFKIKKFKKTKRNYYYFLKRRHNPLFLSNDGLDLSFKTKEPSIFIGVANFAALHLIHRARPQISYLIDVVPEQIKYFKWLLKTIKESKNRAEFSAKVFDKIKNSEHYPNISNIHPEYVAYPAKENNEYEMYWGHGFLESEETFKEMQKINRFEFINYPLTRRIIDKISRIFPFHYKVVWVSNLRVAGFFHNSQNGLDGVKLKNGVLLEDMRSKRAKTEYFEETRSPHYDCFRIVSGYQNLRPMIEVFCEDKNKSELHNTEYMRPEEFIKSEDWDKGVYLHHLVGECDEDFKELYKKAKKHKFIIISEFEQLKDAQGYWNNRGYVKCE